MPRLVSRFPIVILAQENPLDLRIDYHLNVDGPISNALLNLVFSAKISGDVGPIISEPSANW